MGPFPTPIQDIALNLVFDVRSECRFNRTYEAYMDIAAQLPPLKVLVHKINERLQEINERLQELHKTVGDPLPEICRFKAGDERIIYEPFPKKISIETLRAALVISEMRKPRSRKKLRA
jgi:hypothetical protein